MKSRAVLTMIFGAATLFGSAASAQTSAVQRANEKEARSMAYRQAHCPSGDRAACERANERAADSIRYRNEHATRYQRDPNAAQERAIRRDQDSIAYRKAHCASKDREACERANARTARAIEARKR